MQSRISFFNPAIFKKNITQYWPVWTFYLLVMLIAMPLNLFTYFQNIHTNSLMSAEEIANVGIEYLQQLVTQNLSPTATFIFALVIAMAVFSYMFQARSSYTIHALPVCRRSLFITNTISAFCFMVIPQIITFLCSLFICFGYGITDISYLLHGLVLIFLMTVLFLSIAVFSIMVTGNIIAAPIFYVAINFLYVILSSTAEWFIRKMVYGVSGVSFGKLNFLSPFYYLGTIIPSNSILSYYVNQVVELDLNQVYQALGLYSLAGLVIFVLAYIVYQKKNLETTGDMITVPFFIPVIRWIATFIGASVVTIVYYEIFCYDYLYSASWKKILPIFLISGLIIFFLAEMILQKRFAVFKKWRFVECGIYLVITGVFVILVDLNGFGFERKIPAVSQIEQINVSGEYGLLVKPDDYEDILTLHKTILDYKDEFESYFENHRQENIYYLSLRLDYLLKDGSQLQRRYQIPYMEAHAKDDTSAYNLYMKLLDDPQYITEYHFTNNYKDITFVEGHMDMDTEDGYESFYLSQVQCQKIAEALQQDIQAGNYHLLRYNPDGYDTADDSADSVLYQYSIRLSFQVSEGTYYMTSNYVNQIDDPKGLVDCYISLTSECEYTLQALKDMGILTVDYQLRLED